MKAVIQRVKQANVKIGAKEITRIRRGALVLLGVERGDTKQDVLTLARKISELRFMADEHGKINLSLKDVNGEVLVVSQFTLLADTKKGRRPSFLLAAEPKVAKHLYEEFINEMQTLGLKTAKGEFGADMDISLVNNGPVTLILETKN